MAGLRPAGQIPQPRGQFGGRVVAGAQHPDPLGDLGGQIVGEVVRPQPNPFTQFPEPLVLQRVSQCGAGYGHPCRPR